MEVLKRLAKKVGILLQGLLMSSSSLIQSSQGDIHEYKLIRDLMKGYQKQVKPSRNHSDALNVTFGLALSQIIDVDEKNQIITTNCWINQGWIDYKLRWVPEKYGNIEVIRLPFQEVWKPDILLYNNADVTSQVSSVSTNVIVTFSGNVTWLSMVIYKSSCSIDVKYFPFDEQNCTLEFASWTYDANAIKLVIVGDSGDISNYIPNSEWNLFKLEQKWRNITFSCCPEPYIFVSYSILMTRRPLFYLFNMVMPCVLITMVALLGFYMPSDSGEKVSMGITTLLSMTVFLMIVAENMPPTSDVVPLIGLYYGITIAIVSFATGMTVLTLNIHHNGTRGYEVPSIVKKFCFGILAKILCIRLELPGTPPKRGMEQVPQHDRFDVEKLQENGSLSPRFSRRLNPTATPPGGVDSYEKQFIRVMHKVYQTIERNEMRLVEQDRRDAIKQEWQQLAIVIDRLLLLIFLFTTITVTFTIMLHGPQAQVYSEEPTPAPPA
ncbi:neuronal acetylcholine receptor subunit alpha-10-like [Liolophura sinensis]|uniref:neuronal acetylcholine receptor subunit alpha-10-like n=1 Tax=Liolophura sinensis TaxID=3198878 RepID=UPI0031587128